MKTIGVLAVLVCFCCVVVCAQDQQWSTHFLRGVELQKTGDAVNAAIEFEQSVRAAEALPKDWRLPVTLNNLGVAYMNQYRFPESRRVLEQALTLTEGSPNLALENARVVRNLGELNFFWRRLSEAEKYYRRAYKLAAPLAGQDRELVSFCEQGVARVLLARGRNAEAELWFQKAVSESEAVNQRSDDVGLILNDLAVLYLDTHRYAEARSSLERAIALCGNDAGHRRQLVMARMNLATVLERQGADDLAETTFRQAAAEADQYLGTEAYETGVVLQNYGEFLRRKHRNGDAKPLLARAKKIEEQSLRDTGRGQTVDVSEFGKH